MNTDGYLGEGDLFLFCLDSHEFFCRSTPASIPTIMTVRSHQGEHSPMDTHRMGHSPCSEILLSRNIREYSLFFRVYLLVMERTP